MKLKNLKLGETKLVKAQIVQHPDDVFDTEPPAGDVAYPGSEESTSKHKGPGVKLIKKLKNIK